jgi:hypothetical protein
VWWLAGFLAAVWDMTVFQVFRSKSQQLRKALGSKDCDKQC